MRSLRLALCAMLLCVGCAGSHTTGALWAQQNLEQEAVLFKLSDAQRAAQAVTFEQTLADSLLTAERSRLEALVAVCPGSPQPLSVSPGDRVRDAIRLHAHGDEARLASAAELALADWRLRRAASTSVAQFCAAARSAMNGETPGGTSDVLARLPVATVTRDPRQVAIAATSDSAETALSDYALGYVDVVQAPSPLPQYLALVYGGYLVSESRSMSLETAARAVDDAAPAYPEWEPDALYAALRGATS
jgi:hypothetical protein